MAQPTPAQRMEHIIRTYIQACNDADANSIASARRQFIIFRHRA